MTTASEQLLAAGYRLAPIGRMVTLPTPLGDDEIVFWHSPDGRTLTERQAVEEIEQLRAAGRPSSAKEKKR